MTDEVRNEGEDGNAPCALEDSIAESLVAAGAPQARFCRCRCQCRFRWPRDAYRIEARGAEGTEVLEFARCPACRSVCSLTFQVPT